MTLNSRAKTTGRRSKEATTRNRLLKKKLVIFDLDGTLLDSLPLWRRIYDKAAKKYGKKPFASDRQFGEWVCFDPGKNFTRLCIPAKDGKSLGKEMLVRYAKEAGNIVKGMGEVYHGLKREYRIAVVTNSETPYARKVLKKAGIQVAALVGPVRHHRKPDPDQLLFCLKRTKTMPKDAVYIGDMSYDVQAAHRAGMKAIGFSHKGGFHGKQRIAKARPERLATSAKQIPGMVRELL